MHKYIVGLAAFAAATSPASAATEVFITNSGTVTSTTGGSSAGNSATFTAAGGVDHVVMTAFQFNQGNGLANTAAVALFSPGVGAIGLGDSAGAYGYHQIDNAGGYTDFVQLTFDHAVTLSSITLTSFMLGTSATYDNDFSFQALASPYVLNGPLGAWTTVLNPGGNVPFNNGGVSVTDPLIPGTASRYWLIAAALGQNNDGFKISAISATPAVPEPSTWAMMLLGFGAIGFVSRRRRTGIPQVA